MANTPVWLAATPTATCDPGQVNQFHGTHESQWIYSGAALASQQATGTSLYQPSYTQYYAQQFTTGSSQTTLGYVNLQASTVGGSPVTATILPLQVSLYANLGNAPTGAALATGLITEPQVYSSGFWVTIPMLATGLSVSTLYWLVINEVGTGSAYYVLQESNQAGGALTSPDGSTWTTQTYGLMYQIFDTTAAGTLLQFIDDNGARNTTFTYTGSQITGITEYTAGQNGVTFQSTRTLAYNGVYLTGVS